MKKMTMLVFMIGMMISLCGCYDYLDIEEKAMVAGFSVDLQDGEYLITAEILASPSTGSEAEITPVYIQAAGSTISNACQKLYNSSSKQIDFGHCKIIFVSKEFASRGLEPLIDLVFHDRQLKVSVDMMVVNSDEPANEIFLTEPVLTNVISYDVSKAIESNQKNFSSVPRGETYKCLNAIEEVGKEAVLPDIEIVKQEEKSEFRLSGISYFKNDKLIGHIPVSESIYYMMLTDDYKNCTVPLKVKTENEGEAHYCSIAPKIQKLALKTKLEGGNDNPKLVLDLKYDLQLIEITNELQIDTTDDRKRTEDALAAALKDNLTTFISKVQKEYQCDMLKFGNDIYHKRPELKAVISENWDEMFPDLNFEVNVSVEIKSSGTSKYSIQCE